MGCDLFCCCCCDFPPLFCFLVNQLVVVVFFSSMSACLSFAACVSFLGIVCFLNSSQSLFGFVSFYLPLTPDNSHVCLYLPASMRKGSRDRERYVMQIRLCTFVTFTVFGIYPPPHAPSVFLTCSFIFLFQV